MIVKVLKLNLLKYLVFFLQGIEEADWILLIGTNPRFEASLVNARIRKTYIQNESNVALIGPKVDLTYDYEYLGNDVGIIRELESGSHKFWKTLSAAKKPMVILGAEQLKRSDGAALLTAVQNLCNKLNSRPKVRMF